MPIYCLKLRGCPTIIEIEADRHEDKDAGGLGMESFESSPLVRGIRIFKDAKGQEVARFDGKEITGFWLKQSA
jgi:hypothetical protein